MDNEKVYLVCGLMLAVFLAIYGFGGWYVDRQELKRKTEPITITEIIEPDCECTWGKLNFCLEERKRCQNNRDDKYADYLNCRDNSYVLRGNIDGFIECMKAFDYRMCKPILK